jgi:protein-tyrosine phosphatase
MIDIHSHVLWGLDDGATSLEESLAMTRDAASAGTTDLVATPHMNSQFEYQPETASEKSLELGAQLGAGPRLHRGCEFHLTADNLDLLMARPSTYTINGGPYLLLEPPGLYLGKHIGRIFQQLLDAGITPIIAHPERNPALAQDLAKVQEWVQMGCLTQLTALSLTGVFGASAKSAGTRILERGLAHVVASDAHDPVRRHARLDETFRLVDSRYGEKCAEILFVEYPRGIIEGRQLPGGQQGPFQRARRKFFFWRRPSR